MKNILYFLIICCTGCGLINGYYIDKAREVASSNHWYEKDLISHGFQLKTFSKNLDKKNSIASIYIEGDGFAWKNRWTPSNDPTPKDPLTLRLAILDPWPVTVYLGRPCQFLDDINKYPICTTSKWTSERYSSEIIGAMDGAIDQIKERLNVEQIGLTGYSGGGTIATLLAERRHDIAWLITVAANLDHQAWSKLHKVTPLYGSLNPVDQLERLKNIPQVHMAGQDDKIVPSQLVQTFVAHEGKNDLIKFMEISDVDHTCCWPKIWPEILNRSELKLIRRKKP